MSKKYVKKRIPIEVYRLGEEDEPQWFTDAIEQQIVIPQSLDDNEGADYYLLHTYEGQYLAVKGDDYIAKGIDDELYPIKIDIFNKTYEEYEEIV